MEPDKSPKCSLTGSSIKSSVARNRTEFEEHLATASLLHSNISTQLVSALNKVQTLENRLAELNKEVYDAHQENQRLNADLDKYREWYLNACNQLSDIPMWVKSLFGAV